LTFGVFVDEGGTEEEGADVGSNFDWSLVAIEIAVKLDSLVKATTDIIKGWGLKESYINVGVVQL